MTRSHMHMRNFLGTMAAVLAALLFCVLFTIGTRADSAAPTLYCNDEVWYKTSVFPLRVYHSVYVPISIFEQFPGVSVTVYGRLNTAVIWRGDSYISFDFNGNSAMMPGNDHFYLKTYLENNERYVPLTTTCVALGLKSESYYSAVDGSVSARISDGRQTKTFEELLRRYNPGALAPVTTAPPVTTPPETTTFLDPVKNAIFVTIDGLGDADGSQLDALLELFAEYGVAATFFVEPEELETRGEDLLSVISAGHTLGLLVELDGAEERLAEANRTLMRRFKLTTRIIRISGVQPTLADDAVLAAAGYVRWGYHFDLGTTEGEVRSALYQFRQTLDEEGHIVLRAQPDGYFTPGYLREFFNSAQGRRAFFPITPAYYAVAG